MIQRIIRYLLSVAFVYWVWHETHFISVTAMSFLLFVSSELSTETNKIILELVKMKEKPNAPNND